MIKLNNEVDTGFENDNWNDEIISDIEKLNYKSIVVYSRDWTIETIFNQIKQGNIDVDPSFQRRNAWNDERRSLLIESLVLGLPVPEIVLAEHPEKRKSFIVIDGKQRLLTIAGFMDPDKIPYWKSGKLKKLEQVSGLNGKSFADIKEDPALRDIQREFENADIRCTVISNFKNTDVLYDIFYRLNTGSVPLSTQELRQVLNKGPFAEYLIQKTDKKQPIHDVLGIKGPDSRLRDIEIILRFISFKTFGKDYRGNLKDFLDTSMGLITISWDEMEPEVETIYQEFNTSIDRLIEVFDVKCVGKKFTEDKYESRFNRAIFEVQAYYFSKLTKEDVIGSKAELLKKNFEELCSNSEFRNTIEASTKNITHYFKRYKMFRDYINKTLDKNITDIPVPQE